MKRCGWMLVSGWLALAAGCATTVGNGGAVFDETPLSGPSAKLVVFGLSCPLCSNNLDGHLRRIDGVEEATINLDTGEVTVRLAPGHDVSGARLAQAVRDAGFTLREIHPAQPAE